MGVAPGGAPVPRVDAVVFDLGNVLVQWDPRHLYRRLLSTDDEVEAFLAEVCTPEWNEAQDRGRPFAEGIAEAVARHPHHEPLIRAFWDRWDEMVPGPVEGTADVLDELHAAGIPLYALSNWSLETFERVRHRYAFLTRFDGLVISAAERLVKPDPAIFELLLARYGLNAERTAFVDDAPRNVEAAAALGFVALPFTSAARLRVDLAALGLPVAVA
jgi:2-haloacid dehalogenase